MNWVICFVLAVMILVMGFVESYLLNRSGEKRNKILSPLNVLFGSVFVSIVVLFLPIYNCIFSEDSLRYMKVLLLSIHSALQFFVADGEFGLITEHITAEAGWIYTAYSVYVAFLLVLAPVLTFGMVLSFFKNISAYRRFLCGYFKNVYVFSELNEKSLALAESVKINDPNRLVVFTDVFEENKEISYELIERTREIGAIYFKKDIQTVNFKIHSRKKDLFFFTIGENQSKNIAQSLKLIELYRDVNNTHLFAFSTRIDSELLLTSVDKGKMKVRRVNDVRSLINRILYEDGAQIFDNAFSDENGVKQISAVVVGMGQHGTNMIKSLSWFCQMDGYEVTIDAFDNDELAYDKLYVQCPELLSEQYNGVTVEGEAQYRIRIHSGIDVDTKVFADEIAKLSKVTYVLVALGTDEDNIRIAAYLRMLFERNGAKPIIQSIVYNSDEVKALKGITNYRGQAYDIDFIGDLKTSYSEEVIIDSDLENDALARHLKWGTEEEFWKYEYNYRSSIASAIHMKAREACGILEAGKKEEDLTWEERSIIEHLEHRRWNAYMRSEGYIYSGSTEKSSRNDLGKMHHDLVDFSSLTDEEKRKDSKVGSK